MKRVGAAVGVLFLLLVSGTPSGAQRCNFMSGSPVGLSISGQNTGSGFSQKYALTNTSGVIQYVSTSLPISGVAAGQYLAYSVNYSTAGAAPNLAVGVNISAVGGDCVDFSTALPVGVCACNNSTGNLTFTHTGANSGSDYTTQYALTNGAGLISAVSASTTAFTGLSNGVYNVYAVNYKTAGGITNLSAGNNISAVAGACVEISNPIGFAVCLNAPPVITSNGGGATAAISIAENATAVATVTATDSDLPPQTLTFSITGGADAGKFSINPTTGVLTFSTAPDFENPTDAGANNVYDVQVTVSDGSLTDAQTIAVTVTDLSECNNTNGNLSFTHAGANGDPAFTTRYALTNGTGSILQISPLTTAFTALANGVYKVYAVNYKTSTGITGLTVGSNISAVSGVCFEISSHLFFEICNVAPVITSNGGDATAAVSIPENTTAVTTVTASDPGASLTFSITGGADAALFSINPTTGALTFLAAPNFENPQDAGANNVYDVQVTVSDGVLTDLQAIAVTVTNVNETPVITSNGGGATAAVSVPENTTAVTTVTATDPDAGASLTFSITGGADAALFSINPTTGVLTFLAAPNFENPTDAGANNVYDVQVTVSDGSLTDLQDIAVTVTNVNETPAITSNGGGATAAVSVPENTTAVTTVTATDPDAGASLTFSITGGADAALFSINPTTGALTFLAAPNFENPTDAGANNVYDVQVTVSDGSLTDVQAIAVTVTDVAEPCSTPAAISVSPASVSILAGGTASFTATGGAGGSLTWSFSPTTGVSPSSGSGSSTGNVTFSGSGVFTITFISTNNSAPAGCDTPASSSQTASVTVDNPDTDNDGVPNSTDTDDDNDGILDTQDPKPLDTDNDGQNNDVDTDDDGDGLADTSDFKPLDTDNDNLPNEVDTDDDGDGIPDTTEQGVLDGNGKYTLPDADGDGLPDLADPIDTDGDGTPDILDTDDDADGIVDMQDPKPLDTDNDGTNNATDPDDDGDGLADSGETPANLLNTDNDAQPNATDTDDDGDGILDTTEQGILDGNGKYTLPDTDGDGLPDLVDPLDTDGDGTPDILENDDDADGIVDAQDPKPLDTDNDGQNNDVDSDDDGDGLADSGETPANLLNTDNDALPNETDTDDDADGIADTAEQGVLDGNGKYTLPDSDSDGLPDLVDPLDSDGDGTPDISDTDDDADGIADTQDPKPLDTDNDGTNNATDPDDDGDGIADVNETPGQGLDTDNDGNPNETDSDDDGDGIPDTTEQGVLAGNGKYTLPDSDNDGLPDLVDPLDTDGDGNPDISDTDDDGDGIVDAMDPKPLDTDNDGTNNSSDPDDDGDGAADIFDNLPLDTDNDGQPNQTDSDDDNDNIADANEMGVLDGNGKYTLPDADGDGLPDLADPRDSDNDGVLDTADLDDDNDGILDTVEGNTDPDGDGIPNHLDLDSDNDGIADVREASPSGVNNDTDNNGRADGSPDANGVPTSAAGGLTPPDTDGDTVADFKDLDTDNDGISDAREASPTGAATADLDNDGIFGTGNEEATVNANGIPAGGPLVPANTDGTDQPNYRDPDSDNDGINDVKENTATAALDANNDGKIDAPDTDGDGIANTAATDGNAIFGGSFAQPTDSNNDGVFNYLQHDFIRLQVKVMLQGALFGTSNGLMRDDLRQQNFIPLAQPYSAATSVRFTQVGGGLEATTPAVLAANAGTPNAVVDWVFIEIRDNLNTVVRTVSALLQRDGDVVAAADGGNLWVSLAPGSYKIAVRHRNHLGAMTIAPVAVVAGGTLVADFTMMSDAAVFNQPGYEGVERANVLYTGGSVKALWAGNCNADVRTKYDGSANDRTTVASEVINFQGGAGQYNFNNALGYFFGDVNMDGKVKYDGAANDRVILQQILQQYPLNTTALNNYNNMVEQIP